MGLAVLPARLQMEMAELERRILQNEDLRESDLTKSHAEWAEKWMPNYEITEENLPCNCAKGNRNCFCKSFLNAQVFIKEHRKERLPSKIFECI